MKDTQQIIDAIESDKRFAVCKQTINGLHEVSIFYSPLNRNEINRQEIKQTIARDKSYIIAYHECFAYFKKWLSANNINYSFEL